MKVGFLLFIFLPQSQLRDNLLIIITYITYELFCFDFIAIWVLVHREYVDVMLTRSCHWGKSINRKIPFSLSLSIESELNFSFTSTFLGSHGLIIVNKALKCFESKYIYILFWEILNLLGSKFTKFYTYYYHFFQEKEMFTLKILEYIRII